METQVDGSSLDFPPEVVAHAFVKRFYTLLHEHPDQVYKFFDESSMMTRTGADGSLTTVTGMEAIKDLVLSSDYTNVKAEIITVDAQASYLKGVIVIVTGCITDKDHWRRKFTESFFLAPQEKGLASQEKAYFVLNDVFRFIEEEILQGDEPANVEELREDVPSLTSTQEPEKEILSNSPIVQKAADTATVNNVQDPPRDEEISVVEEVRPVDTRNNAVQPATTTREDTPKKSYASIVTTGTPNVANATSTRLTASSRGLPSRQVAPTAAGHQSRVTGAAGVTQSQGAAASSESSLPNQTGRQRRDVERTEVVHAERGYSIYIGDLPHDATVEQVEREFKKFGLIKRGGIQVRRNKVYRQHQISIDSIKCIAFERFDPQYHISHIHTVDFFSQDFFYGFVEFESSSSMEKAIEVSTIRIGGNDVFIQEKRTATRVGDGGNSFQARRGGYRNDNFNGRSDFVNAGHGGGGYERNGYGRNDYGRNNYRRNDYGSRADLPDTVSNGNGYGGRGRGGRLGGRQ
ncbi:hypothetical protein Dimus_031240 [Dionaea muscipula]